MTFRREYICVVEFWSMFLNILVSYIYKINNLIHPRLVGVTQYNQENEWLEELVHHMELVEEQEIIAVILKPPMKIILQL